MDFLSLKFPESIVNTAECARPNYRKVKYDALADRTGFIIRCELFQKIKK